MRYVSTAFVWQNIKKDLRFVRGGGANVIRRRERRIVLGPHGFTSVESHVKLDCLSRDRDKSVRFLSTVICSRGICLFITEMSSTGSIDELDQSHRNMTQPFTIPSELAGSSVLIDGCTLLVHASSY
ncbi:hypothetical protein DENSPDRAFT_853820 [Dentipellis sp. KUC8613]|nr:hypothetical protein DENSPDRAFT_853820 [Dentipellis sp. KUC8613]